MQTPKCANEKRTQFQPSIPQRKAQFEIRWLNRSGSATWSGSASSSSCPIVFIRSFKNSASQASIFNKNANAKTNPIPPHADKPPAGGLLYCRLASGTHRLARSPRVQMCKRKNEANSIRVRHNERVGITSVDPIGLARRSKPAQPAPLRVHLCSFEFMRGFKNSVPKASLFNKNPKEKTNPNPQMVKHRG